MAIKRSELQRNISRAVRTQIQRPAERADERPIVSVDPSPFSRREPVPPPTREQIAEAAYYRAMSRGFAPGHDVEDWIAAERELEARSRAQ